MKKIYSVRKPQICRNFRYCNTYALDIINVEYCLLNLRPRPVVTDTEKYFLLSNDKFTLWYLPFILVLWLTSDVTRNSISKNFSAWWTRIFYLPAVTSSVALRQNRFARFGRPIMCSYPDVDMADVDCILLVSPSWLQTNGIA